MDPQSLRHLHALRDFIRNLVEQAEKSGGCECHRPPSLLLVGPPGAGKTYLVKQMSTVCEMPLFGVHTHQLTGPNSLQNLFVQARALDYPSLFFLDDIESIFSNHDKDPGHGDLAESLRQELYRQLGPRKLKIFDSSSTRNPVQQSIDARSSPAPVNEAGTEVDNQPDNNGLILVAATNSPWLLYKDHELLSRFRGVYLVGLPDRETRFHLLKLLLQKVQHNLSEKDFWLVADKTEGYTPSDLMIVTKALNYAQFSFLFSMAGLQGYEEEESSDEESLSSSEITETDTEDNSDQGTDASVSSQRLVQANDDRQNPADESKPLRCQPSDEDSSSVCQDTTLKGIEKDWFPEVKKVEKTDSDSNSSDEKDKGVDILTINGATKEITCEIQEKSKASDSFDLSETSADVPESLSSSNCDNSSNVMNDDVTGEEEVRLNSRVGSVPSIVETGEESETFNSVTVRHAPSAPELHSDDETKEFELHVFRPPEPLRDDNQAVDSGSDSDNESIGNFDKRTRRVNFCNIPSMHPLSVDVDHSGGVGLNNSLIFDSNVNLSPALQDDLLGKNTYCSTSANNILKRLLASSPDLRGDEDREENTNSKNIRNKDISSIPKEDGYHQNDYLDTYVNASIDRNAADEDVTDSSRLRKEDKDQDMQTFPRSLSVLRNNLSEERSQKEVSSPLADLVSGLSSQLTGVSPRLTPTGSVTSSHLATDNSSESGSGRHVRMSTPTVDEENIKTQDSDCSLYGKSETPTIPSSDISNGNVSGETLECHSDSEDRLRNLEKDLKEKRPRPSTSDEDDEDDLSGEETETETDALHSIFNLNNLGEVSIKILTVNDVLNVVNRTPRSVSDDEIKRYTDFMVWFANVAKSACPHNSKAMSDTASSVDVSVCSSGWSRSLSTKKRKGPFKKLGRFLLKALMFILD